MAVGSVEQEHRGVVTPGEARAAWQAGVDDVGEAVASLAAAGLRALPEGL